MADAEYLQSALNNNSTVKFFIEYRRYLSNHLAHGMIALHHLSATPDRINRFVDWYIPKLEPPSADDNTEPDCDVSSLLGKRKSYYKIFKHFEELLHTKYKSLDALVSAEFPKISLGLSGSALHGTIHLGYGYSVRNEQIVLEGLAYTYHSYRALEMSEPIRWNESFGKGQVDILDALSSIANNKEIIEEMVKGVQEERFKKMSGGAFQRRLGYVLAAKGDTVASFVNALKLPPEVLADNGEIDAKALARRVVYWAILVYTLSKNQNDFFLLHGVTGAWSILQILPTFDEGDKVRVICEFLAVLIGVYITLFTPPLTFPVQQQPDSWDIIVETAIKEDRDEHCYKLVQVCLDLARDPVQGEDLNVLKQASYAALNNKFYFVP